jgi:hypothetical protein
MDSSHNGRGYGASFSLPFSLALWCKYYPQLKKKLMNIFLGLFSKGRAEKGNIVPAFN